MSVVSKDVQGYGPEIMTNHNMETSKEAIFDGFLRKTSIEYSRQHHVKHVMQNDDRGPYFFDLPKGADNEVIDMENADIAYTFRVVKKNGAELQEDVAAVTAIEASGSDPGRAAVAAVVGDNVAIVNNIGHAMFETCSVDVHNRSLTELNYTDIPINSYVVNLLSFGTDAAKTHMTTGGWMMDEPGKFDDISAGGNTGFAERKKMIAGSKWMEICCRFPHPLAYADRNIYAQLPIRIKLERRKDEACLMAATNDYKIVMREIKMIVPYLGVKRSLFNTWLPNLHSKDMEKAAKCGFTFSRTFTRSFAASVTELTWSTPIQGHSPTDIMVLIMDSDRYHGKITKNPFKFDHFNVTRPELRIAGKSYPTNPETCDFVSVKDRKYVKVYKALHDGTGFRSSNDGNQLTPELFLNGATMFYFELSPDGNGPHFIYPKLSGEIDLKVELGSATISETTMVILVNYKSTLLYTDSDALVTIGM